MFRLRGDVARMASSRAAAEKSGGFLAALRQVRHQSWPCARGRTRVEQTPWELGVGLETVAQPGVPAVWGTMGRQYPKGGPLAGLRTHDGHQSRDAGMLLVL